MRLIVTILAVLLFAVPAVSQTLPHSGASHLTENATQNYVTANEMGNRLDDTVHNHLAIAMADANVTLTDIQQWSSGFIVLTGANTAIRELILNGDEKRLTVWNNTTGGFDVTVKYATGATVNVSPGLRVLLHADGTDVVSAAQLDIAQLPVAASVNPAEDRFAMWDESARTLAYLLGDELPGSGGGGGIGSGGPFLKLFHARDEKSNNTAGGTSTLGSFQTRTLNTVLTNEITGASLISNQVTLPAGSFWVVARAPGFSVTNHGIKLRDTTGAADLIIGQATFSATSGSIVSAYLYGRIDLTVSSALELQHRTTGSKTTDGFGAPLNYGNVEVYAEIIIWEIDSTSFRDFENIFVNGDFQISQRGISFTAATTPDNSDDTYGLDRWVHLTEAADSTDYSQETAVVPGAPGATTALKSDTQTANNKFGWVQILPADRSQRLIGSNASLSFQARSTTGAVVANVRAAILCWSGTADGVTSDVVSAWGLPGTNPTFVANWTPEGSAPVDLAVTLDAYGAAKVENVPIDTAGCNNVAAFIWVDEDTAVNDLLYITDVQLEPAPFASGYDRRNFEDELRAAERHFRKSFPYATAPAQNAGTAGAIGYRVHVAGISADGLQVQFGERMFAAPAVTFYDPSAAAATWRNVGDAGASGAATADLADELGFFARNAQVATDGAGEQAIIHYAAESEM